MTGIRIDRASDSSNDDGVEKPKIGNIPQALLLQKSREIAEERTKDWEITSPKAEERIPRFFRDGEY